MPVSFARSLFTKLKRRPRAVVIVAVCAMCAAALTLGLTAGTAAVSAEKRDLPIYNVRRDDKVAAITFDAAWGDEQTQNIIDILGEYGVKCTFFVVGDWVDKYPNQVKALHDAGHEVMNHSNKHPHMTQLSAEAQLAELSACSDKIEAITGERPTLFRAPYGDYNNSVVGSARSAGMFTIQWNIDSLDWKNLSPSQIMARVVPKISPGSIILFHNGGKYTPDTLPGLLRTLQDEGYKLLKVSELIYRDNYYIDPAGTQVRN